MVCMFGCDVVGILMIVVYVMCLVIIVMVEKFLDVIILWMRK